MTRYRIRRVGRRWLIVTPAGHRTYRNTWTGAMRLVDRFVAAKRAQLARTTQADYALAAPGDANG